MSTPCTAHPHSPAQFWAWSRSEYLLNPAACPFPDRTENDMVHFACKNCYCDSVRTFGEFPRFCSTECRTAYQKKQSRTQNAKRKVKPTTHTCSICGTAFSTNRPAKYCGTRCRVKAWRTTGKAIRCGDYPYALLPTPDGYLHPPGEAAQGGS